MNKQSIYNRQKIFQIFSYIILLIVFLGLIWFMDVKIDSLIDSDDSSELLLGKLLASENRLLSPNWYYSTELRVLNTQIFYTLFFKLIDNWHLVRILSYVCMYIILIGVYFFLCRKMGCQKYFAIMATVLVMPFSGEYFDFVLRGAYYIPHIVITFLTLGLTETYIQLTGKKSVLCLIGSVLLAIFVGMGGARQIIILYVPLVLAAGFLFFIDCLEIKNKENQILLRFIVQKAGEKNTGKYLFFSGMSFIGALIGYVINTIILSHVYHFKVWDNISYKGLDFSRIAEIFNGFLKSLGYSEGNIFSKATFLNITCLCWIVLTVVSVVYALKNKYKVKESYYRLSVFVAAAYIVFFVLYVFTDLSYENRYNLPIIVLSLPVITQFFVHVTWKENAANLGIIVFVTFITISSCNNYDLFYDQDRVAELREIKELLLEKDYKDGYTSFWQGNILTELSNGEIEIWCWNYNTTSTALLNDSDVMFKWLQLKVHDTVQPEERMFLLFTNDEYKNNGWQEEIDADNILYWSGNYIVVGYDSFEELKNDLLSFKILLKDNQWVSNGTDVFEGRRELYKEGISFGPYKVLLEGNYIITVQGSNFLEADFRCTYNSGSENIEVQYIERSNSMVKYQISVSDKIENFEALIINPTDSTVVINTIQIEKQK